MKAVCIDKVTPAEEVTLTEIPVPKVKSDWVLVKVRAFGMNHSEQILRLSEIKADYINKPIVPGIECVGEIADASDTSFTVGQKVIALMDGMGRSFNGSYAEYALLPTHHVFAIESDLSWERLAAVPETYFTAWGSLFECLQLKKEDTLLIRGAACALSYAAIQIVQALGCRVIATTHRESKLPLIANADEALLDDGMFGGKGITKALELVGAKALRHTLRIMSRGGIVCHTGLLGGVYTLDGFDPIKEIPNGVYLTGFFSNYPTQQTVDEIIAFLNEHKLEPCFGECFDFEHIKDACIALDFGKVNGKIVVKVE